MGWDRLRKGPAVAAHVEDGRAAKSRGFAAAPETPSPPQATSLPRGRQLRDVSSLHHCGQSVVASIDRAGFGGLIRLPPTMRRVRSQQMSRCMRGNLSKSQPHFSGGGSHGGMSPLRERPDTPLQKARSPLPPRLTPHVGTPPPPSVEFSCLVTSQVCKPFPSSTP